MYKNFLTNITETIIIRLIDCKETNNKFFGRKNNMSEVTTGSSNYPETIVARMIEEYQKAPNRDTVEDLADLFDKPVRGVIAKLVQAGVYVKQTRATQSKGNVVRKADIVSAIQERIGMEVPSLEKASKQDLEKLEEFLRGSM